MDEQTATPTNDELIKTAQTGSAPAMDRLVERYFRVVYAIAYARLENREAAEDLAQEVFLRVFLSFDKLKNPNLFGPWVSRIARNLAHDWHDKGWRASKLVAMVPLDAKVEQTLADRQAKGGREKMESEERNEAVRAAIFQLPVDQRELVLMRYIEGLSTTEIAERLGIHVTTVRRQLDKAVARLKESVESLLNDAAPSIRTRETAAARAVTILGAATILSATGKAAMAQAAGVMAEQCLVSVSAAATASVSAKLFGLLKSIPVVGKLLPEAGGGISMVAVTKVAVVSIGISLAGLGIYKYQAQAEKPPTAATQKKEERQMQTQVRREGDKVWLEGIKGWEVIGKESSVHRTQAAVMQSLGENVTYDYLMGISAQAFRMQQHKQQICPSSPHAFIGINTAIASFEMLPWKVQPYMGNANEEKRQAVRQEVMQSINKGIPVQYGSEEEGLIIGYQKNGTEWICLNEMHDLGRNTFIINTQQQWPWGIHVFAGRKNSMSDRRKAIIESLKKAVEMANTSEDENRDYYAGFAAWGSYINQIEALEAADEKTRGGSMIGNARTYECIASYRNTAAAYLRDIAKEFPPTAADHLRKAADLYDQMSSRILQDKEHNVIQIAPYPWLMKPGQTWTVEMRKDQVRRLKEALPLERQAIEEIEKALKEEGEGRMQTQVKREGDKVWLEGVKGWGIGEKESSVHAAQSAIMQAVGEDVTYEELLGLSGLAFRMQVWSQGPFCPSSAHSAVGFQCTERSNESLPWNIQWFVGIDRDEGRKEAARKAIVESINKGIPVEHCGDEDGLIVGYQKGGREWICLHPQHDWGKKTFVDDQENWPFCLMVMTDRKTAQPDRRQMVVDSLRQAVQMAQTPQAGKYYVGLKAWDHYMRYLEGLDQADEKTRNDTMMGNSWIYECLANYRTVAAKYLRQIAPDFSPQAAEHLEKAADLYEQMGTKVLQDKEHNVIQIAPTPWMMKPGETWTSEMRKEQVGRLKDALPLERQAIKEIEKALKEIS